MVPTFHLDRLQAQLITLHCSDDERDLQSIVSFLKNLNEIDKSYYSEVIKIATNALSERSFSALRRVGSALPLVKIASTGV